MTTWRGPQKNVDYTVLCQYAVGPFETVLDPGTLRF